MTKSITANSEELLSQLQKVAEEITDFDNKLCKASARLKNLKDEYQASLEQATRAWLDKQNKTWCTQCRNFVYSNTIKLVFIDSVSRSEGGMGTWGWAHYQKLQAICPTCYQKNKARHGWHGPWDRHTKNQASYHMYDATIDNEGHFRANGEIIEGPYCGIPGKITDPPHPHEINIPIEKILPQLQLPSVHIDLDRSTHFFRLRIDNKPYPNQD